VDVHNNDNNYKHNHHNHAHTHTHKQHVAVNSCAADGTRVRRAPSRVPRSTRARATTDVSVVLAHQVRVRGRVLGQHVRQSRYTSHMRNDKRKPPIVNLSDSNNGGRRARKRVGSTVANTTGAATALVQVLNTDHTQHHTHHTHTAHHTTPHNTHNPCLCFRIATRKKGYSDLELAHSCFGIFVTLLSTLFVVLWCVGV